MNYHFEDLYIPEPNSGCWLWLGRCRPNGYGIAGRGNKGKNKRNELLAHRVSFEMHRGPIPDGLSVCHKCDTPSCVNPEHLFVGTQKDNIHDMIRKGRQRCPSPPKGIPHPKINGSLNGRAKLTEELVAEIRRKLIDGLSHRSLGSYFGVAKSTIEKINLRQSWAWM